MRPFYPPQVNFKRPKLETVLAFLKSHGWTIDKEAKGYIIVKPPEETRTIEEGGYRYYVPAVIPDNGFVDEAAFCLVETFSEIFEIPLQELFDLLSKDLKEIENQIAPSIQRINMQKAMLANAS